MKLRTTILTAAKLALLVGVSAPAHADLDGYIAQLQAAQAASMAAQDRENQACLADPVCVTKREAVREAGLTHYTDAEMQAMAHRANMQKCDNKPTWFGALACRFDSY
jgi:G3E family GTPase